MTIEDTLRSSLAERLDSLDVPPGDLTVPLREGARRRNRRATGWGLAAACLLLVGGGIAVAVQRDDSRPSPAPAPGTGWTRLPDSPLSPRANSLMVTVDGQVLVLGGEVDNLCPPNADCVSPSTIARDGAAYDPVERVWRRLASAPVEVAAWTTYAVVGVTLVLTTTDGSWLAYDVSDDAWRTLPGPPRRTADLGGIELSVLDGKIYTLGGDGTVLLLDAAAGQWTTLPSPASETPRLDARHVLATSEGVVLLGVDASLPHDGSVAEPLWAQTWDGAAWSTPVRGEVIGGYVWHWTGERLVSPYSGCIDGGEVNGYGRCYPEGGAFDPGSGSWQPLPAAETGTEGWSLRAAEGPLVATWSQVYDDADGSWTRISQPGGALPHGTAATFVDGTLVAFGGVDWTKDLSDNLSRAAWAWTP